MQRSAAPRELFSRRHVHHAARTDQRSHGIIRRAPEPGLACHLERYGRQQTTNDREPGKGAGEMTPLVESGAPTGRTVCTTS
ncbi:hypothetical protein [Streptomyces chartreusis]|uniref:hypothetical protein n=1 Tax=Streptomyces chartreusis TaxID=1969 RepID=UPI0036278D7C